MASPAGSHPSLVGSKGDSNLEGSGNNTKEDEACEKVEERPKVKGQGQSSKEEAIFTSKELEEMLQCPVCWCVPHGPPVYQCGNGHIICMDCINKVDRECPCCLTTLDESRSLVSETLLSKMTIPCRFQHYGCSERAKMEEILVHERKECQFRLLGCLVHDCKESVKAARFLKHLSSHKKKIFKVNGTELRCFLSLYSFEERRGICAPQCIHFEVEKQHFFLRYSRKDKLIHIWVEKLAVPGQSFPRFSLQVRMTTEGRQELTFEGKCLMVKGTRNTIPATEDHLIIDQDDFAFWCKIKIFLADDVDLKL